MIPAAIGLGVGLAQTGAQWWLGKEQAAEQKKAALESERRAELERKYVLGDATARAAASGFEFESQGIQTHLTGMADEFRRQHQWAVRQAQRGYDLANTANNLGAATGFAGSLFKYGAANNWWQKPAGAT